MQNQGQITTYQESVSWVKDDPDNPQMQHDEADAQHDKAVHVLMVKDVLSARMCSAPMAQL